MLNWQVIIVLIGGISLLGCGGSGAPESPTITPPQPVITPADPITDVVIQDITANTAQISFNTAETLTANLTLSAAGHETLFNKVWQTHAATEHNILVENLWADVTWQLTIQAGDNTSTSTFTTNEPQWPGVCRHGNVSLAVMAAASWQTFSDNNGAIQIETVPGCEGQGNGARMTFDLNDGEWVVAARSTPFVDTVDLTAYTHLWIPFRGTEGVPVAFEVKLKDRVGNLGFVRLDGGTGLPVWRSWAVDLREFKNQSGELDLSTVTSLEFGFSWPASASGPRQGAVTIGDLQAWHIDDVKAPVTELEPMLPDTEQMALIAADLLSRQRQHGFIPAWYELTPNWHLYANAMALIVFTLEYERMDGNDPIRAEYLEAANTMADALMRLQSLSNRNGAWDDGFNVANNQLVLKPHSERVMWVGSTAWAGIALILARDILPDGARFNSSIQAAATYYQQSQQCRQQAGFPTGSITEGTEGNLSSHLFWSAAAQRGLAESAAPGNLQTFIENHLFDPQQQRFFCGVEVDIGNYNEQSCSMTGTGNIIKGHALACLDVAANWGTQWLKRHNRMEDALAGLAFGKAIFTTQGFNEVNVKGLGDIAGPWSPTVEHGAGQWAAEGGPDTNFIMNQAKQHLCNNGQCQGANNNFAAGIGWNTTANGIAPAAWMYIAWHGGFWERL